MQVSQGKCIQGELDTAQALPTRSTSNKKAIIESRRINAQCNKIGTTSELGKLGSQADFSSEVNYDKEYEVTSSTSRAWAWWEERGQPGPPRFLPPPQSTQQNNTYTPLEISEGCSCVNCCGIDEWLIPHQLAPLTSPLYLKIWCLVILIDREHP